MPTKGQKANSFQVAVGITSVEVVPYSDKRIALILSGQGGGALTVSSEPVAVLGSGMHFSTGLQSQWFAGPDWAAWVRGPLTAIASAAGQTLGVVEVMEVG